MFFISIIIFLFQLSLLPNDLFVFLIHMRTKHTIERHQVGVNNLISARLHKGRLLPQLC